MREYAFTSKTFMLIKMSLRSGKYKTIEVFKVLKVQMTYAVKKGSAVPAFTSMVIPRRNLTQIHLLAYHIVIEISKALSS